MPQADVTNVAFHSNPFEILADIALVNNPHEKM